MAHLIACIDIDRENYSVLERIISSKLFEKVYLVGHMNAQNLIHVPGVNISLIHLNYEQASEDLVPELYVHLKRNFTNDKVLDLDMAVNITCGTGKEHSVVISTLMKLGYGIRLVDLDKHGNILEMI